MAINTEELEEIQGFKKEIDMGAISSILDNLQVSQYQHPQKSAIRELVSNGLDSVREKNTAISILTGKSKVEDHYITRDDPMNRDSNFDPKYYDLKWLWTDSSQNFRVGNHGMRPNTIYVTYEDGGEGQKDKVIIEDFGVGLGYGRLEGYFKLAYSTKRNTAEALGKFGIGAKAGLSTAPFYTMRSRHNGREYVFNIYPHDIVPIIPKMDLTTGENNGIHMFSNGATIYYRKTDMPNGVRVELESKKHHKDLYIQAVKSQLLYFDNVEFRVKNDKGGMDIIPHKAHIIFENEDILLSDNNQYSKPHILISRVNYGYVDWQELELEDVKGNIALKVPAEMVKVNPSRESLVWNDQTRATVVSYFEKVKRATETMIAEQLKVDDFIEWLEACSQIQSRYSSDSVIGRLSQMVDMSSAKVPYVNDPNIIYGHQLFDGLLVRVNDLKVIREGSSIKYKIERSDWGFIRALADGLPIYLQRGGASFKIDKYLLSNEHKNQGFITVKDPFIAIDDQGNVHRTFDNCPTSPLVESAAKAVLEVWLKDTNVKEATVKQQADAIEHVKRRMWSVLDWMMKSKNLLKYDDIVVPDDFDAKEEVEEEKTIEEVKAKEERQKMIREKGIIPIFTPRNVESSYITDGRGSGSRGGTYPSKNNPPDGFKLYEWQKLELPVEDIDTWDEEEVFFSNDKDSDLLHLAAMITRPEDKLAWSVLQESSGDSWINRPDAYKHIANKYWYGYANIQNGQMYPDSITTQGNPNFIGTARGGQDPTYGASIPELAKCHNFFPTAGKKPAVKLIKVAQDRVKYFLDFKPIQKFFMEVKNKKLTMSNALIKWNTARMIHEELPKLRFLQNFDRFHSKYCMWYRGLVNYTTNNYRELADHSKDSKYYSLKSKTYDDLVNHMDKVTRFQLFVRDNPTESQKIADLAKDMFNPSTEVTDGLAIEVEFYDRLKEMLDFAQPISTLLNEINLLTSTGNLSIAEGVEEEIRFYLQEKGITL